MQIIKGLVENIREELEDVEKYAHEAIKVRAEDPALADVYAELGNEEIKHAERMHRYAVDLIARRNGPEAPHAMRVIWDYEHKVMIEEMAKAKHLLEMARN